MDMLPLALFWPLAIWGLLSRNPAVLMYLLFGTIPFGSFAAIPPALTAGLTFTPTPVVGMLMVIRMLLSPKGFNFAIGSALTRNQLMLLFLFWVLSLFSVIFYPRVFAGIVDIVPMRGVLEETAPLRPTTQNISQFGYLSISIFLVVAFAFMMRDYAMRQMALRAFCFGGFVAVATGLLDFASQYVPLNSVLAPFRTATYALAVDVVFLGGKRVVGLMPEASAYGRVCTGFLCGIYFLRRAIPEHSVKDRYLLILVGALIVLTWMAKSSSAKGALLIFGAMALVEWYWRISRGRRGAEEGQQLRSEGRIAYALILTLLAVGIAAPVVLDPLIEQFDRMVLQKSESASYEGRGFWRQASWDAALATYGIGVGVGSTRASSSVVSVISHTGFLGAALFFGFVLQTYLRRPNAAHSDSQPILMGVRFAFLPPFVLSALIGGIDFGTFNAFLFGIAAATSRSFQPRQTTAVTRKKSRRYVSYG